MTTQADAISAQAEAIVRGYNCEAAAKKPRWAYWFIRRDGTPERSALFRSRSTASRHRQAAVLAGRTCFEVANVNARQ